MFWIINNHKCVSMSKMSRLIYMHIMQGIIVKILLIDNILKAF